MNNSSLNGSSLNGPGLSGNNIVLSDGVSKTTLIGGPVLIGILLQGGLTSIGVIQAKLTSSLLDGVSVSIHRNFYNHFS